MPTKRHRACPNHEGRALEKIAVIKNECANNWWFVRTWATKCHIAWFRTKSHLIVTVIEVGVSARNFFHVSSKMTVHETYCPSKCREFDTNRTLIKQTNEYLVIKKFPDATCNMHKSNINYNLQPWVTDIPCSQKYAQTRKEQPQHPHLPRTAECFSLPCKIRWWASTIIKKVPWTKF